MTKKLTINSPHPERKGFHAKSPYVRFTSSCGGPQLVVTRKKGRAKAVAFVSHTFEGRYVVVTPSKARIMDVPLYPGDDISFNP